MNEPALLELFTCLRKAGLPLGLAEYHLLLESINAGFGTRDRTALAQLCCALWVKSQREEQIFHDYFDQIIPERLEQDFFPGETEKTNSTDTEVTPNQNKKQPPKKYKTPRIASLLVLGLAACVVAIGSPFLFKKESQVNTLNFSGTNFLFPYFIVNIGEKVAHIKITRTGSRHGSVSAELNVGKNCRPNEPNDTYPISDTPQVVQFKDGELGEKTLLIPISNARKTDFFQKKITLCLIDPQGKVQLGDPNKVILLIQNYDYFNQLYYYEYYYEYFNLLLIIFTCIILLPVAWKMWKIQQTASFADDAIIPETYTNLPKTMLSPEVMRTMADEIQVAKTIRQSDNQLSEFPLIVNDLPVTHRQMKQGWRYLRQFSREGPPIELDMEATIQQVAQYGVLLNPVLVPRRTNRIELLLLIDQDGSMVPFHHLSQQLADTALRGGRFSRVRVYYFHNCPDEYLYRDRYHLEAEPIDDCLSKLPKTRTVCLIFSDAGAARGGFSSRRRRLTKFFLKELRQYVRYSTWLNPVPRDRWETTTAQDIAALVPMFEVNRQEFYRAINVLRGRHQPLGEVR
ncbi:VWA domain-containing protein [Nostoc sp.]|uniref:VWA domain-containing protein n=1 Tax=Nostoc sp. TaxID=1180 RepID=UPI002FF4F3DB